MSRESLQAEADHLGLIGSKDVSELCQISMRNTVLWAARMEGNGTRKIGNRWFFTREAARKLASERLARQDSHAAGEIQESARRAPAAFQAALSRAVMAVAHKKLTVEQAVAVIVHPTPESAWQSRHRLHPQRNPFEGVR